MILVKLTQKTHDNGADIVVRALNKGEIKGLIQVKHKLHNKDKIGITPVRELLQQLGMHINHQKLN